LATKATCILMKSEHQARIQSYAAQADATQGEVLEGELVTDTGETVADTNEIDILHSKMKPAEKDEVMERFAAGEVNILCATSVVEVGVNVPNATVIIIEGAERFGLAQLHQLRGRVIRSSDQAYCYLFSETKGEKTFERLKALTTAKNGFELSEMDLTLRGAGELGGGKQWGISDIGMEAIKNIKMVEAAREEAKRLLTEDISLSHYPSILARLSEREKPTHFE
jgi:ATP-dependent DNA helicase RecG